MVDFVTEVLGESNEPSSFPTFSTPINPPVFTHFSQQQHITTDNSYMHPVQLIDSTTETSQNFMSLGQLSNEYATYLLLNQSGFNNDTIMAAAAFQKTFPLPTGSQPNPNSLSSLLPYASLLGLMGGFDSSNLLGNLQILQAAANAMSVSLDHQQNIHQGFAIEASSAATCASSVIEQSASPLETNNNALVDPNLLLKQQFMTPTSSPPSAIDDSLQNSISKNKLGRSYNPGRPLSMVDRQRILDLYKKGYKISHIARIIGVTHSCVSKIMTRYRRTGSMHPRSAQIPRKNSSNSSPTRSSTSPLSNIEVSSIFTTSSSIELSDSASSTCSFLVPQPPIENSLIFNIKQEQVTVPMAPTTNEQLASLLIHKPVPVKSSVYCTSN